MSPVLATIALTSCWVEKFAIEICKPSRVIGTANRLDTVNELDLSVPRHLVLCGPIDQKERLA
jgi:hypothetical protein